MSNPTTKTPEGQLLTEGDIRHREEMKRGSLRLLEALIKAGYV